MAAIEAHGLTKTFTKKVSEGGAFSSLVRRPKPRSEKIKAVDHISFSIGEGELFGLLGPNGAGKTTTIKLLCTLLIPDEGTATVNGYDVVEEADEVRASVGVVTGGERGLYWRLTGRENLKFFADLYNVPEKIALKRIDKLLRLVELHERADERVEKYSRGMKQRLHLIRGLVNDPPILLLDEPTLGLDPASARVVRDFIKEELQESQNKTILLTTHYMEEADQLCDRIAIIDHGKIIAIGTPEELKRDVKQIETIRICASNYKPSVEGSLKSIPGIKEVAVNAGVLGDGRAEIKIHAERASDVLAKVTEAMVMEGVRIDSLQEVKPTLEDVFISLTGRKLRD